VKRDVVLERDPWAERGPLPTKAEMHQRYLWSARPANVLPFTPQSPEDDADADRIDSSDDGVIRTALCVEAREGRLYIFMPPQRAAEDYIELVAALEATAKALPARRRVAVEVVVPHFRLGNGAAHARRGLGNGVTPEVDWHATILWSGARPDRDNNGKLQPGDVIPERCSPA
jgi:uncharacterized protein (DUF2126 family)